VAYLANTGPAGRDVEGRNRVERATIMMRDDHYGWFEKVERASTS